MVGTDELAERRRLYAAIGEALFGRGLAPTPENYADVHAALKQQSDYRILVTPDHPTFLRTKTHSHGYVPFAMCGSRIAPDLAATYDEIAAANTPLVFEEGWKLM